MNDEVNNPSHYNQNGIEVIDVIETYTPDSPHLANVLKYVCRHSYKGNPLKDLRKAAWYLDRAIILIEDAEEEECLPVDEWRTKSSGYSPREVEVFFQGYDCRKQEEAEERGLTRDEVAEQFEALAVHPAPDRIAGDDPAAQRIKDKYYGFDRYEIKGYCANCDKEIGATQPHITGGGFDAGVLFCKPECLNLLREWQGR
jgi:hypothetical protein